jgi:maltooligosyltrehalose trehalohydrolase
MMNEIRVWAPEAPKVELESHGKTYPLEKTHNGWWSFNHSLIRHGFDYAFKLDGQGPFPDPRSAWQPEGVHGPSRFLDHGLFQWTDPGWRQPPLAGGIIYEMHTGTFTPEGTFDSAIGRLDHLRDLGVTHVELMPVAEFLGNRGWGYDGAGLFAPHHSLGGPEGLKRLVNACHVAGLAVLLDVVYNHLGPSGNYLNRFGHYFTERYSTPWGQAVNLDGPDSDEVRRFFVDNALMWLKDYHFDGLRIDAVHALMDLSATHFLEQLAGEVREWEARLGRHLALIAESNLNDPRTVNATEVGGYGISAQWNEDFHHSLHTVLTGEKEGYYRDYGRLADLAKSLSRGFVYDGIYSVNRRRRFGRSVAHLPCSRFVGYLQNHDQVGNRALGERIGHLLPPGRLRIGAALVLCAPFIPMLFQGEEWAASSPFFYFTGFPDSDLGEAVKRGRREEFAAFGWNAAAIPDPQDERTFLRSKLDWNETARKPHSDMLEWYRALIEIRCRFPDLVDGRFNQTRVAYDEDKRWIVMERGSVVVACNLADAPQRVPCSDPAGKAIVLASEDGCKIEPDALALPGQSVAIAARVD